MRRRVISAGVWQVAAVASMAMGWPAPAAGTDPAAAAAFVQRAGNELAALIAATPNPADRRARLVPFLDRTVDIEGIARFCAGRYWRTATPEQQRDYVALFRETLAAGVGDRLGAYQGGETRVITGRPEARPDGVLVPTTIQRADGAPVRVAWVVEDATGTPRIADVIAEGISLRLTQRSDQTSFLARHNGDLAALITALRAQRARQG